MSTNYVGQYSDFHRITSGMNPLLYLIHSCQKCGFTGGDEQFTGKVDTIVAERIKETIYPLVRDQRLRADERWEFAARIAEWRGQDAEGVAFLYLNAAWCGEADRAREMFYRRKAADYFEKALEGQASNPLAITYLVGELYRRVGEPEVAGMWFDQAIAAAGDDPAKDLIKKLALRQKTDPKDAM
jgi:tetratricopeptide (TPR) repeat protein